MEYRKKNIPISIVVFLDLVFIGIGLVVFALFHHVIPQTVEGEAQILNNTVYAEEDDEPQDYEMTTENESQTEYSNFDDKFTQGDIMTTQNSYVSDSMSITIDTVQENGVTYYVADIYLKTYTDIMTAFAQDTYGKAYVDDTLDMAIANDAVLAISGDYYGNSEDGLVIRNGVLYRDEVTTDVLVMYTDGTMETYSKEEFDSDTVIQLGAYQAWEFGPMLLDNGQIMTEFEASRHVQKDNPRCGIGYFEPGHYCFVVVDGRQEGYSDGVTLNEFSQIFYDLGCDVAYNMDGGKSAVMVFMDEVVNQPASGGREISDIVYIGQ